MWEIFLLTISDVAEIFLLHMNTLLTTRAYYAKLAALTVETVKAEKTLIEQSQRGEEFQPHRHRLQQVSHFFFKKKVKETSRF